MINALFLAASMAWSSTPPSLGQPMIEPAPVPLRPPMATAPPLALPPAVVEPRVPGVPRSIQRVERVQRNDILRQEQQRQEQEDALRSMRGQ